MKEEIILEPGRKAPSSCCVPSSTPLLTEVNNMPAGKGEMFQGTVPGLQTSAMKMDLDLEAIH